MDREDLRDALIDMLREAVDKDLDGIYLQRNKIKALLLTLEECPECAEVVAIGKEWGVKALTPSGFIARLAVRSLQPQSKESDR